MWGFFVSQVSTLLLLTMRIFNWTIFLKIKREGISLWIAHNFSGRQHNTYHRLNRWNSTLITWHYIHIYVSERAPHESQSAWTRKKNPATAHLQHSLPKKKKHILRDISRFERSRPVRANPTSVSCRRASHPPKTPRPIPLTPKLFISRYFPPHLFPIFQKKNI